MVLIPNRCHALLWPALALAQQSPTLTIPKFDNSIQNRYRQDLCSRQRLLYNDNITLADALKGIDLNIVLTDYSEEISSNRYLFSLNEKGEIPSEYPGLFAVLLDELARRAGFRWRNSFGTIRPLDPHPGPDGNKTWTDILLWETENYDIAVEYYSRSIERMKLGVSFPEGWFDSSIIFVELAAETGSNGAEFSAWSFMIPFSQWVWFLIASTIFLTGFVYWILERLDHQTDEANLKKRPFQAIFMSAMTFTGHLEFSPSSHAGRLLTWSWSFWALITAAAYTANLASFLVMRKRPSFRAASVDQAVRLRLPLCVRANTWNEIYLQNKYGGAVNLVKKMTEDDIFEGLRNGDCVVALPQASTFRRYERSNSLNGDCRLKWTGVTAAIIQGGFATSIDTGTLCTSLVSHVLDLHMLQMKADGFLERAWEEHLAKVSSHTCAEPSVDEEDGSNSMRLGVREMGGIFILHGVLSMVSICIGLFLYFSRRRQNSKSLKDDEDLGGDSSPEANELPSDDYYEASNITNVPTRKGVNLRRRTRGGFPWLKLSKKAREKRNIMEKSVEEEPQTQQCLSDAENQEPQPGNVIKQRQATPEDQDLGTTSCSSEWCHEIREGADRRSSHTRRSSGDGLAPVEEVVANVNLIPL